MIKRREVPAPAQSSEADLQVQPKWDYLLLLAVLSLVGLGLVMVLSSSFMLARERFGDPYHFFRPQVVYVLLGLVVMVTLKNIPYRLFCRLSRLILLLSLIALTLVLIPGIGHSAGGAARWLKLGGLSFQPTEIAKVALVIWLAASLAAKRERLKSFTRGLLPYLLVLGCMVCLTAAEPDFGSSAILCLLAGIMFFVSGVRLTHLITLVLAAVPVVYLLIIRYPYRLKRIAAFMSPWDDPLGAGYHIIHSFMAFASGGLTGLGPGGGRQKLFFLPEPHTDFIFAVVGEELGFVGVGFCGCSIPDPGLEGHSRGPGRVRPSGDVPGPGVDPHHRLASLHEHGRGRGIAAHQGPDTPVFQLRRFGHAGQFRLPGSDHERGRSGEAKEMTAAVRHEAFRLMVAGGGTGGHLFPGVAVAEEFLSRDPETKVLFVGTGRPVEAAVLDPRNLPHRTITAAGLKGMGLIGRLRSLARIPVGLLQSLGIIMGFKPDVVLGVGGYVSGPVGLAAKILMRPAAVQEQNSIPGLTNRMLGRIVDAVFISFEASRKFFPAGKVHMTGNPVRREIAAAAGAERRSSGEGFTLLVAGGSQGAHAVNMAVVEAVRLLAGEVRGVRVIHQTGSADEAEVRAAYSSMGVKAEVEAFIHDMERVYLEADLAICRAGALTLAEISALGLPSILIPLPTAADNHQEINALSLVEAGAAEMIVQKDLTAETLSGRIKALAGNRSALDRMSLAARTASRPDAVAAICDLCLKLAGREATGGAA